MYPSVSPATRASPRRILENHAALLELTGIEAGYAGVQVLWGVDLELREREIVALLGANGAGKTTVLRTISGIVKPWHGDIVLQKQNLDGLSPREIVSRGVIHVPEGRHVFPRMSVVDNLRAGAYTERAWSHQRETLEEVYGLFPRLYERRSQLAGTLSGGEQQMLAIGRGLMARPKCLMIDEPSLGLAPKLVDAVLDLVIQIRDLGCTVLLVEQNAQRALEVAERAYVMEHGRILFAGASAAVAGDPAIRQAYLGL
ncbi:ABC transporter ATP-binding protein [bacterium]|nr:MAG: ABC transporter ATP-binding protein [bacterium]